MACYISSNDNRFYAALEASYGTVAPVTAVNRFPALGLKARQRPVIAQRRDKTGSRTHTGASKDIRMLTDYSISTYLSRIEGPISQPPIGALLQAAMGAPVMTHTGGTLASPANGTELHFTAPHGMTEGAAVVANQEIRVVTAVVDAQTVEINAPFTGSIESGTTTRPTTTYALATRLPSLSIYDYWDPEAAVHRLLAGAAVSILTLRINGDFHELHFSGPAAQLLDSVSLEPGQGGLSDFPGEPALTAFQTTPVPGHLGQIWVGAPQSQLYTITQAELTLDNKVETRCREFGSPYPRCLVPGTREVSISFSLYEQENEVHRTLYQAAKRRDPISLMLQLGQTEGQLCAVYLKGFVPAIPEFDDAESRLKWTFAKSAAQGTVNDELYIAFG
jgi:hypothetical protein